MVPEHARGEAEAAADKWTETPCQLKLVAVDRPTQFPLSPSVQPEEQWEQGGSPLQSKLLTSRLTSHVFLNTPSTPATPKASIMFWVSRKGTTSGSFSVRPCRHQGRLSALQRQGSPCRSGLQVADNILDTRWCQQHKRCTKLDLAGTRADVQHGVPRAARQAHHHSVWATGQLLSPQQPQREQNPPDCLADGEQGALPTRCRVCMAETSVGHQQQSRLPGTPSQAGCRALKSALSGASRRWWAPACCCGIRSPWGNLPASPCQT